MNPATWWATTTRVLRQLVADRRTIGIVLVVPTALLVLLHFVFLDVPVAPGVEPAFPVLAVNMYGIFPMVAMFLITSITMQRERVTGALERLWTTRLHRADLLALLEMTAGRAIVAVDEAYIEYSPAESLVDALPHYPHLAIIRTLSKAFALAGLRCGFTLANPELIALLQKTIAPYPLPGPVADLAAQALQADGLRLMRARVAATLAEREHFAAALRTLPAVKHVEPSGANFLLIRCHDGPRTFAALSAAGIITRSQQNALGLADHIRITIGSAAEMAETLTVLKQC